MNKLIRNEQVNFETWNYALMQLKKENFQTFYFQHENYEQVNEQWTNKLWNMKLWTS